MMFPANLEFDCQHCKADQQDGSSDHSKRYPWKSVVLIIGLARVLPVASHEKKSKVGEMTGLATQKIVPLSPCVGCVVVVAFGTRNEAFVFASPFGFGFVIIAQAHLLVLLCGVGGQSQANGQWRVQFGDGVALRVQKSDVENGGTAGWKDHRWRLWKE